MRARNVELMRFLGIFACGFAALAASSPRTWAQARPLGRSESQRPRQLQPFAPADEDLGRVELEYGQSSGIWQVVSEVKNAQGNFSAINEILMKRYGAPEEALATIKASADPLLDRDTHGRIHVEASAQALGYGLVQNPVVPELHADAIAAGGVVLGYGGRIEPAAVDARLCVAGGSGREKRIDAVSTDLIERLPLRDGALTYYGLDLDLSRRFQLDRENTVLLSGLVRETSFQTTTPSSPLNDTSDHLETHRWKASGALERRVGSAFIARESVVALEGFAGPQPLPIETLPRIWDYAHRLYATPELGAMTGAGLRWNGRFSRAVSLEARGGYYGGYAGGSLVLALGSFSINAASWGIETTAGYHVLGERLWQGGLAIAF
jgi:hypothetical protein